MCRVSWISAGIDATRRDDSKEEDWVPDVVEGVDADALSGLQADSLEACGELSDGSACSSGRDVV